MDYLREVLPVMKRLDRLVCHQEEEARKAAGDDHEKLPESRFRFMVKVITEEGGVFLYENAYAYWIEDWFCVVAEHCPEEAHHREELLWCGMYERQTVPNHSGDFLSLLAEEAML